MTSCSRQNLIKSAFLSGFYCISMNGLSGGRAFVLLKLRRRCAQRGEWKISLQRSAAPQQRRWERIVTFLPSDADATKWMC